MSGIVDYIKWRGDLDFNAAPFNAVDNLILSELSYMSFVEVLGEENRTLINIKNDGFKSLYTMSKNYTKLDKETKKAIRLAASLFFEEGFRSFLEVKNPDQWNLKLSDWRNNVSARLNKLLPKKDNL